MPDLRVKIMVYQQDGTIVSQYLLGEGEHAIGRDPNSAIYCESPHVSNDHAKLHLSDEGIFIEDLNSTSGTFLDQINVRGKVRLTPGQRLQVGDLHIDLQLEGVGDLSPGVKIGAGRYQLNKELGRGAMGQVWLAQDTQLDELVAIKVLPSDVANDAVCLLDLKREVQKSRKLSHDNIIRIHDLVQLPGENPFISLEYVEGTDLHAIQVNQPDRIFSWQEVKPYVMQLCDALDYAHERKIVHRDLKPANIMITHDGVLKLADFGIAASIADATGRSSMADIISGTPQFMSPQQMLGESPKASDDIYALGATMYCLLTGRPPFHTGDIAQQAQHVTPAPLEQRLAEFGLQNEVPDYVNDVVMSCLAKDATVRPASAGAIGEWLRTGGKSERPAERKATETGVERMVTDKPVATTAEPEAQAQATQAQPTQAQPTQEQPTVVQAQRDEEKKSPILAIAAAFIVVAALGWFFMGGSDKDNENKNQGGGTQAGGEKEKTSGNQQAGAADSLKEGLVAYYPFNGNANDESGNGNDGEVKGATLIADRHGKENSAYDFNKNEIAIPTPASADYSSGHTMSVWAKVPDIERLPVQTSPPRVVYFVNGSLGLWINGTRPKDATDSEGIYTGYRINIHSKAGQKREVDVGINKMKFNPSEWFMMTASLDNKVMRLHINGSLAGETILKDFERAEFLFRSDNKIGASGDYRPTYAQLDDVRIYDRALSTDEITALYDLEKPKTDLKKGLVAYYPFNGNANDESGNQLHGTVQEGQLYPDKNGQADSSYEFKGNGKITLPESQKFELQKMTLSAWVNISEEELVGDQIRFLIDKRNKGESIQHYALMFSPSEAFTIYSKNPTTGANTYHSTPYGDNRPQVNQWVMVTGTYDGLSRKLYVAGKLADHKIEKVSVLNQRPFDLAIGCALLDRQHATWRIDDVRIYNRTLSADEITALYDLEKPKKFRLNQIKEYELRSLNENPSFEQGKSGWVPGGGEIILVPNNNDLAGGKNALTLKKPAGYGRLATANKINLKAGKKYRTIIVLTGEIDIPSIAGDSLQQYSGIDTVGNDTYTTYHSGGKTILDQVISFPKDRSLHFRYALYTKEQITFEHFFIVEERNTASVIPNSPEAAAAIEAAIRKAAGKPTGELTQADLEKVTRLDLQANHLTEAPKGLEKLTNLESLVLYNNQLTNAAGLEKLTQLKGLELGNNQLTDVADLGKLTQLRELNIASNNHPIKVPKGLEKLTQLTSLHLSANQLTEPPESLEKLTGLKYLYLQQNQLTEIPKSLEKLTQLGYLNLKDNPALTKAQIDELQKALPECKIEHNATK